MQEREHNRVLVTDYAWESLEPERKILEAAGASLLVAESGDEEELIRLVAEVEAILTCWKPVSGRVMEQASQCRIVSRYGIGLDNIDVARATELGILVTNVPTYCLEEVSDHAMALILACARRVVLYDRAIKAGNYDLQAFTPLYRVKGKTLGITGFGKIGRTLYTKARGFGLHVLVFDPYLNEEAVQGYEVELVELDELLQRSDFISIHTPLSPETHHLFGRETFRQMKPSAFVINTSRGEVVDPDGLLQALEAGEIAGAALDVLAQEPPAPEDPLVCHPRTIITPHAAFCSQESLLELQETAASQVAHALTGKVVPFVVNPGVLEQSNLRAERPSSS